MSLPGISQCKKEGEVGFSWRGCPLQTSPFLQLFNRIWYYLVAVATPLLRLSKPRSHDLGQRFVERDTLPGDHVDLSHNA